MKELLNKKQRQQNVTNILNALNPNEHNFNTVMIGFLDIIQSSFYNFQAAQCKTKKEQDDFNQRINEAVNDVMELLNQKALTNADDIIILTTILIECFNKALYRQKNNGLKVETKITPR